MKVKLETLSIMKGTLDRLLAIILGKISAEISIDEGDSILCTYPMEMPLTSMWSHRCRAHMLVRVALNRLGV